MAFVPGSVVRKPEVYLKDKILAATDLAQA
jgi:hypothetical protein